MKLTRVVLAAILGAAIFSSRSVILAEDDPVSFSRQIQPLLARRCFACHGNDKGEGGLRLNKRDAALEKLESGLHAIVAGKPEESALLARVTQTNPDERMPPEGKPLTETEVSLLKRWIAEGANWQGHWAFESVKPQAPPPLAKPWARNPIDHFVGSKLEKKHLSPASPAGPVALLRRIYYDLTGLPPSPDNVTAFLQQAGVQESSDVSVLSPEASARFDKAYEATIDQLLASPRYGERWARHWLDVVRYAETNSFERDGAKPYAWGYRDYVIRSFNTDKPYDRFVKEQLAGDELPDGGTEGLTATGFYRLGLWDDEPADRELAQFEGFDDLLTTIGQGMLGLTVNCARCHDHKIDPFPQADYYRMLSFVRNINPNGNENPNVVKPLFAGPEELKKFEAAKVDLAANINRTEAEIKKIEDEFRAQIGTDTDRYDLEDLEARFYRDSWQTLPPFDEL